MNTWKRTVRRGSLLLAVLLLLLSSCGTTEEAEESGGGEIEVYYKLSESRQNQGDLIGALQIEVPAGTDLLHAAMRALQEDPQQEGYEPALPANVRLSSYAIEDGALELNVTGAYTAMSGLDRTIAKACITMTLCSLSEVDRVSIVVDGNMVDAGLTLDSIVLPNTSTNEYERQLTMYFPESRGMFLLPEAHTLTIGQDKLLAEYAMDELIRGPQSEGEQNAIPEGTEILSVEQRRGVCTINLSADFYDNRPKTAAGERMTVYSIVNTLTAIEGVDAVQLLVDGERLDTYVYTSLAEPLQSCAYLIGPVRSEQNEILVYAYLQIAEGQLTPVPMAVARDSYDTVEQCAVRYVLDVDACCGYTRTIPEGCSANSVEISGNTCLIDLSAEFTEGRSASDILLAAKSLAATVIDLGNVQYVTITVDGRSYSNLNRLTKDEAILVR